MLGQTTRWPAEALWQALYPTLPGFTVEVLPQIDSTNSELMRRARAGQCEPVLLVAEQQTAGRGRLGRTWVSGATPHASLTFSLGLPMQPQQWSGLSLAVGLCVAECLHPQVKIKWPNDLWWQDRKLGGILIETSNLQQGAGRYVVVGIGINIETPLADDLRTPAVGLQEIDALMQAPTLLSQLVLALVPALQRFAVNGFAPLRGAFAQRDALHGRALECSNGVCGQAAGVDDDGTLLVHTAQGVHQITSAEVSVRPACASPGV